MVPDDILLCLPVCSILYRVNRFFFLFSNLRTTVGTHFKTGYNPGCNDWKSFYYI